jgi:hypothetical protein
MPPKRLLEPPASPEVKSASPKRRRRGAARGGARRGTPKRNARGLFEVGLAIEDMVRDVEAANDLFPDEPCGEHEPCGEDDDCGGPLSGCDLPCFQEGRDTCPACAAGTQEAFGRRQLVLKGVDKGDLVRDDLLPSGKNTILDVSITRPLVDTAASKYEAKKGMDYDAVIGTKGVDFGVVLPGDFNDARRTVDRNPYRLPSLCRLAPLPLRCGCACCTGAHGAGATVLGCGGDCCRRFVGLARLSREVEAANDERQRHLADHVARRMLRERAPSPHGDSDSDEDPYAWGSPEPVLGHVPGYARRH